MTPEEFSVSEWRTVLQYNSGTFSPELVTGAICSAEAFSFASVAEVYDFDDGQNDGESWIAVLRLSDSRWVFCSAWCDYTGWDCQSDAFSVVAESLERLVRFGIGRSERGRMTRVSACYDALIRAENPTMV